MLKMNSTLVIENVEYIESSSKDLGHSSGGVELSEVISLPLLVSKHVGSCLKNVDAIVVGDVNSLNGAHQIDATATDSEVDEEFIEELMFEIDGLHFFEHNSSQTISENAVCNMSGLLGEEKIQSRGVHWKLPELKEDDQEAHSEKNGSESAIFPILRNFSKSPHNEIEGHTLGTSHGTAHLSATENSILLHCNSMSPKSALRGSYEELGLGPRPKLHVKWDPDIYEPSCSSVSHTLRNGSHKHRSSKKKTYKHQHKGKSSSHSESYKKHDKKGKSGRSSESCKKHDNKHCHESREVKPMRITAGYYVAGQHQKTDVVNESKLEMDEGDPVGAKSQILLDSKCSELLLEADGLTYMETPCANLTDERERKDSFVK